MRWTETHSVITNYENKGSENDDADTLLHLEIAVL